MSAGACLRLCVATPITPVADQKEEGSQQQQKLLSARRHQSSHGFWGGGTKGRQLNLPSFSPSLQEDSMANAQLM